MKSRYTYLFKDLTNPLLCQVHRFILLPYIDYVYVYKYVHLRKLMVYFLYDPMVRSILYSIFWFVNIDYLYHCTLTKV